MAILIVAATTKETDGFLSKIVNSQQLCENLWSFSFGNKEYRLLVTGIGSCASTYFLLKEICKKSYNAVWNIGVAGAFSEELKIGEVVNVVTDCFADLGSDDNGKFLSVFDLKLENENAFPFEKGKLVNKQAECCVDLQKVNGITVNKASGNSEEIDKLIEKYNADVESMEGAAIAFTCIREKIPFLQIRAISNYVAPRKRQNWNIDLALINLHNKIFEIMEKFKNEDQ
jgi:futalosine hydrolase